MPRQRALPASRNSPAKLVAQDQRKESSFGVNRKAESVSCARATSRSHATQLSTLVARTCILLFD